jgi:hypothetical protein
MFVNVACSVASTQGGSGTKAHQWGFFVRARGVHASSCESLLVQVKGPFFAARRTLHESSTDAATRC